jgi:hypothetical protein
MNEHRTDPRLLLGLSILALLAGVAAVVVVVLLAQQVL